jgi:DNA polymerase-3 subunit epsilon
MNRCIIDIEVGGWNKRKNALCSIGALVIDHNLTVVEEFYVLIKPHVRRGSDELSSYKPDAMQVNGLNEQQLKKDGLHPSVAMEMIEGMIKRWEIVTFAGHNIRSFDAPWLNEYMDRFGSGYKFSNTIDTLEMSRKRWNLPNYDLTNICKHLGIKHDNAHHALSDCRANLEVYRRLV